MSSDSSTVHCTKPFPTTRGRGRRVAQPKDVNMGVPESYVGLSQVLDRGLAVAADAQLPQQHVLEVYEELHAALIASVNRIPDNVGNNLILHRMRALAGHAWWKANRHRYENLFRNSLTAEAAKRQGDVDAAGREILERLSQGIVRPGSTPTDAEYMQIVGCCIGLDEISDELMIGEYRDGCGQP